MQEETNNIQYFCRSLERSACFQYYFIKADKKYFQCEVQTENILHMHRIYTYHGTV